MSPPVTWRTLQVNKITQSQIKRDVADLEKIQAKPHASSPFYSDATLGNIVNGIVAGPDVTVHDFESFGDKIIEKISYTFKQKNKAMKLGDISAVKITPGPAIGLALL